MSSAGKIIVGFADGAAEGLVVGLLVVGLLDGVIVIVLLGVIVGFIDGRFLNRTLLFPSSSKSVGIMLLNADVEEMDGVNKVGLHVVNKVVVYRKEGLFVGARIEGITEGFARVDGHTDLIMFGATGKFEPEGLFVVFLEGKIDDLLYLL